MKIQAAAPAELSESLLIFLFFPFQILRNDWKSCRIEVFFRRDFRIPVFERFLGAIWV